MASIFLSFVLFSSVLKAQPPNTVTFSGNPVQYADAGLDNPVFRFSEPEAGEIIICYEFLDRGTQSGFCQLAEINSDTSTLTFSKVFEYETGNASDPYLMPLPPDNNGNPSYVIGYTNGIDSSTGPGVTRYIYVENTDVNNADIDFSDTFTTFNNRLNDQTQLVYLGQQNGPELFAVCYSEGPVDEIGIYCSVGEVDPSNNGATSYGEAVRAYADLPTDGMVSSITRIGPSNFIFCFDASFESQNGVCRIGNVNITGGNNVQSYELTYSPAYYIFGQAFDIDYINVVHVELPNQGEGALVCYQTFNKGVCTFGFIRQGPQNTYSVEFPPEGYVFDTRDPIDGVTVTLLNNGGANDAFVVCYDDVNSDTTSSGYCVIGYLNTGPEGEVEITYSQPTGQFYSNGPYTDGQQVANIGNDQLLLCYFDADVGGFCDIGTVSRT